MPLMLPLRLLKQAVVLLAVGPASYPVAAGVLLLVTGC
jgi:hypothetical protein